MSPSAAGCDYALLAAAGLCVLSVLGSQSRGALLALVAMLGMLWLKSTGKFVTGTLGILALALALLFMPPEWMERMRSIPNYQEDLSALGRINAWWFAVNLANDHPIVGGGLQTFTRGAVPGVRAESDQVPRRAQHLLRGPGGAGLRRPAAVPADGPADACCWPAARSAWHGIGRTCAWAALLAGMLQVSLVGYVVGGLFLGLAYFDLPYSLLALVVATHGVVAKELRGARQPAGAALPDVRPAGAEA